ncbi:MAG: DUF6152 family protein [Gammaproteobacteria bacterium]
MLAIALRLASGALLSTIFAAGAAAHHAFSTEFDAELTGEVRGEVVSVFWANPHIRYDVRVAREDGTAEVWELAPPGNLPTYRREGWHRDTIQPGYIVRASGNLGRDGAKRLYATCIELESGPEKGRRLGCANPTRTETEVAADPNARYTYAPADFPVDITGYWDNRYKFRQTADDLEPKPVPMTDEARAIYESRRFGDDDVLRCMPAGLPRIFGSPYPMEIFNAGTHYLVLSLQDNTPRWIWMDGRSIPDHQPPTYMGFSTGRWEGRTLVIETTRLVPTWLDGTGYPMTGGDETRIVERWTVSEDGLTMDRTMTIHDPLYTEPLVRTRGSQRRSPDGELVESEPCDPNLFYRDLLRRGQLEDYLRRQ